MSTMGLNDGPEHQYSAKWDGVVMKAHGVQSAFVRQGTSVHLWSTFYLGKVLLFVTHIK